MRNNTLKPSTQEQNVSDIEKVKLLLDLGWLILILLLIVTTFNLFNERYHITPNIFAITGCLVGIIYLRKTKNYQIVGGYAAILGVLILDLTIFFMKNTLHYTTPMWMMMHICVIFFVMGYRWGTVVLSIHFTVLSIYVFSFLGFNFNKIETYTFLERIIFCIEFMICGFGIAFTLRTSLKFLAISQSHSTEQHKTLRKQFDLISKQNEEKKIMLQEIHHRVKNNLQLVSSLLNIQRNNIVQNETPFEDSIARIKAMALIHEKYYAEDVSQHFSLKDYLEYSTKLLAKNYDDNRKTETFFTGDEIIATQDSITPMALLFNELVLGSMKRRLSIDSVQIKVHMNRIEDNKFEISYQDNTDWKTIPVNPTGVLIIEAMIDQLDGALLRNKQTTEGLDCLAVFPCPMERFTLDQ